MLKNPNAIEKTNNRVEPIESLNGFFESAIFPISVVKALIGSGLEIVAEAKSLFPLALISSSTFKSFAEVFLLL